MNPHSPEPSDGRADGADEAQETSRFDSVRSPYQSAGEGTPAPDSQTWTSWDAQPVADAPKKKATVGLRTALALMVLGSVATGTVVGVASNRIGSSASSSSVVSSLDQPSMQRTSTAEPGSAEQVAKAVLPSVVSIQAVTRTAASEGSGSIISSDGYVMTNNHVVSGASQSGVLEVTLADGTVKQADFVAGDASTDIAVIKIRDATNLPVMAFGDSNDLAVGQDVMAIGSPLGLSSTVTTGIVSAMNRPVRASGEEGESSLIDAIQTDAAINPGNSGGPLVDMQGNQVGINSVIASVSSGGDTAGSIGLGFAIPANFAKRVATQLIDSGVVTQPMIGVQLAGNSNAAGALISSVQDGGPGAAAGLAPGDVVTKLNDRPIDSADALIAAVRSQNFGETIRLTVTQQNTSQTREVEVTLTSE
nr:trypsin-like peptidase domain-containing protein [Corynebacterium pacaense]